MPHSMPSSPSPLPAPTSHGLLTARHPPPHASNHVQVLGQDLYLPCPAPPGGCTGCARTLSQAGRLWLNMNQYMIRHPSEMAVTRRSWMVLHL